MRRFSRTDGLLSKQIFPIEQWSHARKAYLFQHSHITLLYLVSIFYGQAAPHPFRPHSRNSKDLRVSRCQHHFHMIEDNHFLAEPCPQQPHAKGRPHDCFFQNIFWPGTLDHGLPRLWTAMPEAMHFSSSATVRMEHSASIKRIWSQTLPSTYQHLRQNHVLFVEFEQKQDGISRSASRYDRITFFGMR